MHSVMRLLSFCVVFAGCCALSVGNVAGGPSEALMEAQAEVNEMSDLKSEVGVGWCDKLRSWA